MKTLKKLKFNFNTLALFIVAGSLSLYHLSKDDIKLKGLEQTIESLQNENEELENENNLLQNELDEIDETRKLLLDEITEFFNERNYYFWHQENGNGLIIYGHGYPDRYIDEIPEEIYYKINQFSALNSNIKFLKLINVLGNIDFSKLDLSSVEIIDLSTCSKNVSFSGANLESLNTLRLTCIEDDFDYSAFENKKYDSIHLGGENQFINAIDILENSIIKDTSFIIEVSDNNKKQIFDYLKNYPQKLNEIHISSSCDNYEEILELSSKLNADSVSVSLTAPEDFSREFKIIQPLNINLELNPNINKFEIYLFSASSYGSFEVNEINITSGNENVEVIIDSTYMSWINENTKINVPNFDKFSMMLLGETTVPYQKTIGN